jgi:hypothetical protein
MVLDPVLFDQSIERERRRRRRDLVGLWLFISLLLILPMLGVAALTGQKYTAMLGLIAAIIASVLLLGLVLFVVTSAGETITHALVHPGGAPRTPDGTSMAEAIAMSGDMAAASATFEALRADHGETVASLRTEAELYAGPRGDAERAKGLFQRMRRAVDATRHDELYATQRLIDLYYGPLNAPDRAAVELRRIIERFPGTRDAEGAALALDRHRATRQLATEES